MDNGYVITFHSGDSSVLFNLQLKEGQVKEEDLLELAYFYLRHPGSSFDDLSGDLGGITMAMKYWPAHKELSGLDNTFIGNYNKTINALENASSDLDRI